MNTRFLIAGIAAFMVSLILGFLTHGMLLQGDYAQLPNLMRTEADAMAHLPFLLASHLIKGFAFAWVYSKGISSGPWLNQGLRFGVATVFLVTVPLYLVYYAVQPEPGMLVVKQIVADSIAMILMGVVVAMIMKPAASSNS